MLYRLLLRLYPHDFRRRYQDELEADFDAQITDARESGPGPMTVVRCYARAIADVLASAPREWLRTPWLPAMTAAAIIASGVFYYVVGRVYFAGSFRHNLPMPQSPELFWLMAAMVFIPLAILLLVAIAARFAALTRPPAARTRV